jgi:shikimate dehydrogenase
MHNAAFAELSLDWVYLAFDVEPGAVHAAFAGVRALGIGGLSVTIPHKAAALEEVDEATAAAQAVGAVNTVVARDDGRLLGDNTDGAGFLASLSDEGFAPAGRVCLVVGAGGAARAVVHALAEAGAAEVMVANRTAGRGETVAALAGGAGRVASTDEVVRADLVVNATPLGLAGSVPDALPVNPALLGPGQLVLDLIPNPAITPLMRAARDAGCQTAGGLGMLVHQGALAFEQWTGRPAPLGVMRAAAVRALG